MPETQTAAEPRRRSASSRDIVCGGEKGGIPVQHEHIVDVALRRQAAVERPQCSPNRVAGAERRVLHDALRRRDEPGNRSIRGPITTTVAAGDSGCSASSRCAIIGRPAIGCITLGTADFIRVPLPAARMMAANRDGLIDGSKQFRKRERRHDGARAPRVTTHRLLQNVADDFAAR